MKNLTKFYLNLYNLVDSDYMNSLDVDICTRTLCSIQSQSLRIIELDELVCRQGDILTLLDKHRDTLEILRLSQVTLLGSWSVVMVWISDSHFLKFLSVHTLLEIGENTSGDLLNKDARSWVNDGFGGWDESGHLSRLDSYLEQKRKEQAELQEED
jgi:hypothetical protein